MREIYAAGGESDRALGEWMDRLGMTDQPGDGL
jgi:hypothetical protein